MRRTRYGAKEEHSMWDKTLMRLLAILYIVGGAATLLAPGSVGKLSRWFADNPRYMRLDGMLVIALGIWLALRHPREE